MQTLYRLVLLLALALSPAFAQRKIGEVSITVEKGKIPVHVSRATPELDALARQAFDAHGVTAREQRRGISTFVFAGRRHAGPRDVTKGLGGRRLSPEIVTGTSLHHAALSRGRCGGRENQRPRAGADFRRQAGVHRRGTGKKKSTPPICFSAPAGVKITSDNARRAFAALVARLRESHLHQFLQGGFPVFFRSICDQTADDVR